MQGAGGEAEGFSGVGGGVEERSLWSQLTLNYFDIHSFPST